MFDPEKLPFLPKLGVFGQKWLFWDKNCNFLADPILFDGLICLSFYSVILRYHMPLQLNEYCQGHQKSPCLDKNFMFGQNGIFGGPNVLLVVQNVWLIQHVILSHYAHSPLAQCIWSGSPKELNRTPRLTSKKIYFGPT